jgi:hypothetical protein
VKLRALQAVVAATVVCVGVRTHAQQAYPVAGALDSASPATSKQSDSPRVYQYPTISVNAEATGAAYDLVPASESDRLTYNDYYSDQPTPADGYAPPGNARPTAVDEFAAPADSSGGDGCGTCRGGYGISAPTALEPFWAHRTGVFAEALYLRPRGATVAFGDPQLGGVSNGTVGTINPQYSPGYRLGATFALSRSTSIQIAYTNFQSEANGSLFVAPPLAIQSFVTNPIGPATSLADLSRYTTRFQFADVDYRQLLSGGRNWYVNYSVGSRYGILTQQFRAENLGGALTSTNVGTNINFEGVGARFGLQAARQAANRGFLIYGKTFASILAGNNRASFLQTNSLLGVQSTSAWTDFRTVPILEYEVGGGWRSANGRVQITAGYYFGAWFNTVSTGNFIQTVQNNNYNSFVNNSSTITFDGLTTRFTYLW